MICNDINIDQTYGCRYVEITHGSYSLNNYAQPPDSLNVIFIRNALPLKSLEIIADIEGATEAEIHTNISNLTSLFMSGVLTISGLGDGMIWKCTLTKVGSPKVKAPWIKQVKFQFIGYTHGKLVTVNDVYSFIVSGNYKTGAILTLTNCSETVTVMGITISNITGNTIVIDGTNKTITEDGVNKMLDCDLTEFPVLLPGNNSVFTTSGSATVSISYYPIWI